MEDGSACRKICVGPKAYRSIIEHVRRAHGTLYSKQPSSEEGWNEILRRNGISTSAMQRSVSNGSSASGHSPNIQAPRRRSVAQQLPTTSAPKPVQTLAMGLGSPQVPAARIHGPAFVTSEQDRVAQPRDSLPREFVHPYMLQHEAGPMALYQQIGHADSMGYNDQSGMTPVPFSAEQGRQELGHVAQGRQLSMDGALRPYFADSTQPNQLDPTLGPSLFPSLSDNIAQSPTQPTQVHPAQQNEPQQYQFTQGQAVRKRANSRQEAEPSIRKRGLDDTDGMNAEGQERPLKKMSAHSRYTVVDSAARHIPNGRPGFGGPIPPLTAEWFGLELERLAGDPFSVLIVSATIELTAGVPELSRHQFRKELLRRWPTADKLAVVSPAEIMALVVSLGLGPERAERLRDTLQTLAKEYDKMPPTKDRRFGLENYPPGAVQNIIDDEVFEAEENDLANEVYARNASWEITHITKRHVVIDAWRIFCRDVLLGRAQDWTGTGAAPGFDPEWKRVSPEDPSLRSFLGWMWMREGWFWDPDTGVKQPLPESTRLAVNQGRVHWNAQGHLCFRTSAGALEPISACGTSPAMASVPYMNGGASVCSMAAVPHSMSGGPDSCMSGLPSSSDFIQLTTPLTNSLTFVDAGDPGSHYGLSIPIDGPGSGDSLSAYDPGRLGMFNGGDGTLNGGWAQYLE